jgi:hypothetical protein
MQATAARPRSPAQVEASRRNGARSQGPVTAEGKELSSRNALQHGLCAMRHLVLEDEVPDDLEELIGAITAEAGAGTEIEARLARRLAIAFWKGERAERIEVALFDAAPRTRMDGYRQEEADPLTTFDVRRFNAIRGHQAQIGREIARCLKELRQLRRNAALAENTCEPETASRNEPEDPPAPANDDAPAPRESLRNEPEPPPPHDSWDDLPPATRAELDRLLAADDWPGLSRLGATGALRQLGLEPEDLASPRALGRVLYRPRDAAPTGPHRLRVG